MVLSFRKKEFKEVLEDFEDFMRIDLDLRERTIANHLRYMRLFFKVAKKPLSEITRKDVGYLGAPGTQPKATCLVLRYYSFSLLNIS